MPNAKVKKDQLTRLVHVFKNWKLLFKNIYGNTCGWKSIWKYMKCCLKIKNGCLEIQTKHPLNILESLGISNHCSVPIHNDYGFEIPNHCLHMVQLLKDVLGLLVSHIFIVLWFSTLMTNMGVLQLIKVRRKCIFGLYILGCFSIWFLNWFCS